MTGATHSAPISHKLRRFLGAFSDIARNVNDHYRGSHHEPLERVRIVLVDAEIRRAPFAYESVIKLAFLLDHYRLERDGHRRAIALERQVLPHIAFDRFGRELEVALARRRRETRDPHRLRRRRNLRQGVARTGARDPATIDEYVALAAFDLERHYDVVADGPAHDAVVDQHRVLRLEAPARLHAPQYHVVGVDLGTRQADRRIDTASHD